MKRILAAAFFIVTLCFLASCVSYTTRFSAQDISKSSSLMELFGKYYRLIDKKETQEYSSATFFMAAPSPEASRWQERVFFENIMQYCSYKQGIFSKKDGFNCEKSDIPIFNGKIKITSPSSRYDHYWIEVYTKEFHQQYIDATTTAKDFLEKITVNPIVIDESGFYKNEKINVSIEKYFNLPTQESKNKETTYDVGVTISSGDYDVDITDTLCRSKHNSPGYQNYHTYLTCRYTLIGNQSAYNLRPKLVVKSKKFDTLNPNADFADKNFLVKIKEVTVSSGNKLSVSAEFENKTTNYLLIESIAIHINSSVLVLAHDSNLNMPPHSTKAEYIRAYKDKYKYNDRASADIFDKACKDIGVSISKNDAKNRKINLGISVKYKIGNSENTLYKTKTFMMSDILAM